MKKLLCMVCLSTMLVSLASCGTAGGEKPSETTLEETAKTEISLKELHNAVKEAYGEAYIPSMELDADYLKDVLGVSSEMYDEYIAEGPMMSVHVQTFVAIKAKEGKEKEVVEAFDKYKTYLEEGAMQYPMNMPIVKASQVLQHGQYVFFVMLSTFSDEANDAESEEELLEYAKNSNQIAINVIEKFFE